MKILLIAGHGQGDPGARGNGTCEETANREEVTNLYNELKDYAKVTVYPFEKNCYKQNKAGNPPNWKDYDYVMEVHFNAFDDKTAHGSEILVHGDQTGNDVERVIMSKFKEVGFRIRGDGGLQYRRDLMNMNCCKAAHVHYSLLETCFITNQNDMTRYNANKKALANKIAESFISVYDLRKKEVPTPAPVSDLMKVQVGPINGQDQAEVLAKQLSGFIKDYKYVQVGAYREVDNALEKIKEMLSKGYEIRVTH